MTRSIVIAAVQANPTVGAIAANEALARRRFSEARAAGADLAVFPELFINGYPPEDLALKPAFWRAGREAIERLALETDEDFAALVGVIWPAEGPGRRPRNGLAFLAGGKVEDVAFKCDLPNYGVFDEKRVFEPGEGPRIFTWKGVRLGVPICEDIWTSGVCADLAADGAEILVAPNGSPYRRTADQERTGIVRARVAETGLPMIYLNEVGGQDELVFDGASFALDGRGREVMRLPMFEEAIGVMRWTQGPEGWTASDAPVAGWMEGPGEIYHAMVLGLRDYVNKSGFPGVLLGLSGGVDSAITAVVAADALGPDRVRCFMLPSRYTSRESLEDAEDCARRLGVRLDEVPIAPAIDAFGAMLTPLFENRPPDLTEENIQARIRGLSLMALSNKLGSMLLTTGNKSEMATGYCTLYGDMAGGFAVIKDVAKTLVYRLCEWKNRQPSRRADGSIGPVIPERIITRPPSAELRPDQTDQDSLPPYEVLDGILARYMEEDQSIAEIVAAGYASADVERVTRLIKINEYKRRQSPVGIRITHRAFGRDWRYPITSKFRA